MGRIVAIAGGDLSSTRPLNQHAIQLSGKSNPNVLFIGTASHDAAGYIESIAREFVFLGCNVKALRLANGDCSDCEAETLLAWADVIYVGGGDTVFMMQTWKRFGLDEKLKRIYAQDAAVLTGLSAGAICWFRCGHSDSGAFQGAENWNYCWADGMLDIVPMAYCPHYNEEGRDTFDAMLRQKDVPGLAMENDTAFVSDNGEQYFIRSAPAANAYFIQYRDGLMEKKKVTFRPLDAPLEKR